MRKAHAGRFDVVDEFQRRLRAALSGNVVIQRDQVCLGHWPEDDLMSHVFCLSMILSENRYPLFGIML